MVASKPLCDVSTPNADLKHAQGTPIELFLVSSQCSTTGLTKAVVMCYPVCGMVHIKEPVLLIGNSSPCGGSGFPLSLSEWSFTIISDAI